MDNLPNCVDILVVDDDEGHVELVRRNLRRAGLMNAVIPLHDGRHAVDYVFRRNRYSDRKKGGHLLILLDIKMPGEMDGIEVLRRIKADASTDHIPVIMLTTTDDPREVDRCYELGCSVYITKPVDPGKFMESIRRLGLFISVVSIPSERMPATVEN